MNYKSIQKMFYDNARDLTADQITNGLRRIEILRPVIKHTLSEVKRNDGLFLCRSQMWWNSKHGLIARIGKTKDEALAKVGLALPLKKLNLNKE